MNKFNIPVVSNGFAINNYIFNGRIFFNDNKKVYSRRINRNKFGIYILKNEKLSQ